MTQPSFHSTLTQHGTTSSREAAIFLHGLDASDRAWLLEQLEPTQRGLLTELLAELATLGVPPRSSLGRSTLPAGAETTPDRSSLSASPTRVATEQIKTAPMSEVVDILRREPDAVVVRVMRQLDPGWSLRFSRQLDAPRRARVVSASCQAEHPPAEALDLAVLQAVCRRVGRRAERTGLRAKAESTMRRIAGEWRGLLTERQARGEAGS